MSRIVKIPPPGKTAHPSVKKAAILDAARARFEKFGFSKVTVDEIAHDIGIVKGAVYYYFPTKEKIFEDVMREEQAAFMADIEKMLPRPLTAAKKLGAYIKIRQQYLQRLENLGQIDYESWQRIRPNFQELFQEFEQREISYLKNILEEGKSAGEFDVTEPRQHALLLLRTMKGLRLLHAIQRNSPRQEITDIDHEIHFLTTVFLAGICR